LKVITQVVKQAVGKLSWWLATLTNQFSAVGNTYTL